MERTAMADYAKWHARWHGAVDEFLRRNPPFERYGRPAAPLAPKYGDPMKCFAHFITYQAISTRVCDGIWDQLVDLVEALLLSLGLWHARHEWPPDLLLRIPDEELYGRGGVGLSRSKIRALKGMARHLALHRTVDDPALASDEIVRAVAGKIKGVGPFTVASFLIEAGRLDVANHHDIRVREGMRIHYGLAKRPTLKQAAGLAAAWGPHKTIGTKYMFYVANRPPRMPEHLCHLYDLAERLRRR